MGPTGGKNAEEVRLPVVMNFLRTSSAATDAGSLMTRFFNALKTAVDFDIGAYLVDDGGRTEGRVYAASFVPPAASDDFSRGFLRRAAIFCPGFFEEMLPGLDVSVLMEDGKGRVSPGPRRKIMHSLELPLVLEGEPAGVITLGSYRDESPFSGTSTINAMTGHLVKALNGLLANSAAEETRLRNILFSISDGVFLMDRAGRLTAVNPMALELISLFCSDCAECISRDDGHTAAGCGCEFAGFIRKAVAGAVSAGTMANGAEIKNADGRTLALSVRAVAGTDRWRYSHVITARDVTDEKLMQKNMLISSKLASIGEMVAGIAHEINNPLQAVLVNMELLDGRLNEAEAKRLGIIKGGVMRIRDIVKDLLVFARNETTGAEKADVNILIEKSADIIRAQMKMSNVSLRLDLYPSPLIAKVNKNLFKQVMINLLQNAKDAIEGASRAGTVTVTSTLLPYMRMRVLISDDGPGIPEEIMDKIFDPFFTTKDVGKGTGLGLSVSRKIIEKMGGQIGVKSASGRGTTFAITFPHCGEAIDERRRERMRNPDQSVISGKTVLIADDESEILNALKDAISPHVSRVDAAASGSEALERIKAADYDLVLLDINMPGMNGMEVFMAGSCIKPGLARKVIFLTGDTENEKTSDFLKRSGCRYLCKPLGTNEILNAMCEAAGRTSAPSKN